MKNIRMIIALVAVFLGMIVQTSAQQLAFPTAEGHGRYTTGGRAGTLYIVSNLNDSGTGSLRAAVEASGKRVVVFSVSGTIKLASQLTISKGDITILGQTAPGDGICIANYTVQLSASNIVIRYIRFRPGSLQTTEYDASWGRNNSDIIFDHCSFSWGNDEQASFYDNKNFTMQYCIIAESFYASTHPKGNHGFGGIWGGMGATFHHNLIANHTSRTPRFCGARYHLATASTEIVDFRNNVIFNWGYNNVYGGESGNFNMVNNYYKPGPATSSGKVKYRIVNPSDTKSAGNPISKWYITGNYVSGNTAVTADNWNGGVQQDDATITLAELKLTSPVAAAGITTQTAADAYTKVLASAGASLKRDAADSRVVAAVSSGTCSYGGVYGATSGIIDNETQVGGHPALTTYNTITDADKDGMDDVWEKAQGTKVGTKDDAADADGDGYTNIEEYANCLTGEGDNCETVKPLQQTLVYNHASTEFWATAANWTPAAVPTAIDTAIIRTGECKIAQDFANLVRVESSGVLRALSFSTIKNIELQGGTLLVNTSNQTYGMNATITVKDSSTIKSGNNVITLFTLAGTISGNENLTKTGLGLLKITATATNFTGKWFVIQDTLTIASASGLGTAGVEISDTAVLDIDVANATGSLLVKKGGKLNLDANLTVQTAVFDGVNIPAGTYSAIDYPAVISGSGKLIVLTCPACPVVVTQSIALTKGWNLISINVRPADSTIATLFTGSDVLEIKDMNSYWRKDQPSFLNLLQTITAGDGYLVNMNAEGTLTVTGTPVQTQNFASLPAGWNLIGCPYPTATPIAGVLGSNFSVAKNFTGFWTPTGGAANSIQNIEPGKGYFFKK